MKVYLDTGVFVDYLIYRGHAGVYLRTRGRRNRTIQQLSDDVFDCLNKIKTSHSGFTSSLTLYEVEEAMYAKLVKASRRTLHRKKYVVISSRALVPQTMVTINQYSVQILDLSQNTILRQLQEVRLQLQGIRAADSLHMATAILCDADIIITTDKHLLNLNNMFQNQSGAPIQCLDTNIANQTL